jgi:hypothetical protein
MYEPSAEGALDVAASQLLHAIELGGDPVVLTRLTVEYAAAFDRWVAASGFDRRRSSFDQLDDRH